MRKLHAFTFFMLFFSYSLLASEWSLQVRGAYFRPSSRLIRKVSSSYWFDYQVEANYNLSCGDWQLWTNVSWFARKKKECFGGSSCSFREDFTSDSCALSSERRFRRRLFILPLSLGLKYHLCILPNTSVYIGAGVSYTFLKIRHAFPVFYKQQVTKRGLGVLFKSGLRYDWGDYTFIEFFADYLYQRFRFSHIGYYSYVREHKRTNVGGLKVGLGIGVYF